MDELVAWVRVQAAVDQRCVDHAEKMLVPDRHLRTQPDVWPGIGHAPAMTPWRYAAEVEAKRRILDLWDNASMTDGEKAAESAVYILAQVYAGRPGFKDEWRLT